MRNAQPDKPFILRVLGRMSIGGVQNGLLETLSRRDRSKYDYALLCYKKEGNWADRMRALDVPVYAQKALPTWDPYQIWRFSRVIARLRPTLVHAHMSPTVIPALTAARLAGVRHTIVHHHNDYAKYLWPELNPLLRGWEMRLTRRADAILAVSASVARATEAYMQLPRGSVEAIPNGIDFSRFDDAQRRDPREEWGLAPGTPLVVHVSRYLETKNVEDFIEAAALVNRRWTEPGPRPAFVVIGDGPGYLRERYEAKIKTVGGSREPKGGPRLWLEGSRHDLPAILPAADVGALASENEGCPNTILEYMAAGLPIAATDIEPITDILTHATHGLLSRVHEPQAMAVNIERLLKDRALARQLRTTSLEEVRRYDWQRAMRSIEAVYDRLLTPPSARIETL